MLVENEPLVAMDLEAQLDELGYTVSGPYRSCARASAWLKDAAPALAVVGYSTPDDLCDDLLIELHDRAVPTLVLFDGLESEIRADMRAIHHWLEKPFRPRTIRQALERLHDLRQDGASPQEG